MWASVLSGELSHCRRCIWETESRLALQHPAPPYSGVFSCSSRCLIIHLQMQTIPVCIFAVWLSKPASRSLPLARIILWGAIRHFIFCGYCGDFAWKSAVSDNPAKQKWAEIAREYNRSWQLILHFASRGVNLGNKQTCSVTDKKFSLELNPCLEINNAPVRPNKHYSTSPKSMELMLCLIW